MSYTRLTPDQQYRIEAWTLEGIGPAEQARRLGLPVSRIECTRRKLLRGGQAPKKPRQPWRYWTTKETDQLIDLVEQGYSYAQIAKRLKRTETSVKLRAKRIGVRVTTTNATMSCRDVASHLGIPCSKAVSGWIRRGWLKARDAGKAPRILWRITWDDLTAFLENPAHWVAWRGDRIPDLALREWALELRAGEERLLSQSDVARRYHVTIEAVGQWIYKGWLPSVRYGNRRVPASALDGWIAPIDRKAPMGQHWPADGFEPVCRAAGAVFYRRAA